MTAIHTALIHIKSYLLEFSIVLTISSLSTFDKIIYAINNELNEILIAHIIVGAICALIIRLFVIIFGRWIGEELDDLSDVDFTKKFNCERSVFELLKNPHTHGSLYRQNVSSVVDGNKIKVYSRFIGIKTIETFELNVNEDTVFLKNIGGKYESNVTYKWDGSGIIGNWIAKPKGLRRAITLLLYNVARKTTIEDFQKFLDKNKV